MKFSIPTLNKNLLFLALITALSAGFFFASAHNVQAGITKPDYGGYFQCTDTRGGRDKVCTTSRSQGRFERQIYGWDWAGTTAQQHDPGVAGNSQLYMNACLSVNAGVLGGYCGRIEGIGIGCSGQSGGSAPGPGGRFCGDWGDQPERDWTRICDSYGCGQYDEDEAPIGDLTDYNWVVTELIVNDATIKSRGHSWERWVELHYLHVNGQDGTINMPVGQGFAADWGSSEGAYATVYWGGALGSGSAGVGTNDARGFSCQSVGQGWVRIVITGPGGWGPDYPEETEYINCTVPTPGNIPWLDIEPCVDGNRFDLEWGSAQYANDYLVQRRAWSGGSWVNLVHTSNTHFETYEAWDTDWYFRVTPRNSQGQYGPSITEWGGNCPGAPTVDIRANNQQALTIPWNTGATLSWTTTNANSCNASGSWSGGKSVPNGTQPTGNLTSTQTYVLTCVGPSGAQASDSVTVTVQLPPAPNVDLLCNGAQTCGSVPYGSQRTLSWSITNGVPVFGCSASNAWSGSKTVPGTEVTSPITNNRTYTIQCQGPGGWGNADSVTVTVPAPTVDITANGSQGPITIFSGGSATLNWTTSNAASCTGSGSWSGAKGVPSGSQVVGPLTPGTHNYVLTCAGNGSTPDTVTINVPVPTGSISSNPNPCVITSGSQCSSTITWNTPNSLTPQVCVNSGSGYQLFASGSSGSTAAPWIQPFTNYVFTLFSNGCNNGPLASVTVTAISVPVTSGVSVTLPDYCTVGPSGTVSWNYSDPVGSTQTAYQVQIDDNADFSSPIIDTGQITSASTAYTTSTGILQFNSTYRARVRVWNGFNQPSNWTNMSICSGTGCSGGTAWTTPIHAYPNNRAPFQFTWSPQHPPEEAPVQFSDHTQFAPASANRQWSWTFVPAGGGSGTSTAQNPVYAFDTDGVYQITQRVRDNSMPAGQFCTGPTQAINVQKPIPIWIEVAPR